MTCLKACDANVWREIPVGFPVGSICLLIQNSSTFLPEASFGLRVLSLPVSVCVCVCINHLIVRTITGHLFMLGSPNLVQRSKTPWLRFLLFWGQMTLTFKVKFNFKLKIDPILSLPNHRSPPILVRISKFGQQMHFRTVKIPVNLGLEWPWP